MAGRIHALESLIALDRPLPEIIASLHGFPWDSDEDLVILESEAVATILDRFLRGELSNPEVEAWANAIESREDIGFDEEAVGPIRDAIHHLANPELMGSLTQESASGIREELGQCRA